MAAAMSSAACCAFYDLPLASGGAAAASRSEDADEFGDGTEIRVARRMCFPAIPWAPPPMSNSCARSSTTPPRLSVW